MKAVEEFLIHGAKYAFPVFESVVHLLATLVSRGAASSALLARDLTGMWINRDVDVPQALVAAQREGRLVIFAGAGVSMGPPANLASFEDLAASVGLIATGRDPGAQPSLPSFGGRVGVRGVGTAARCRQGIRHLDPLSFPPSAIEEHEQDHTHDDWGLIIDIARDNLDWAVTDDTALASATIASWITAGPSLLKRLGIHGTARRSDVSASDRLDLMERHQWLCDLGLKHETFESLRQFAASQDVLAALAAEALADHAAGRTTELDPEKL